MLFVFDFDGTLSLLGDRVQELKKSPPDWDKFYARCKEDLPNKPILRVLETLYASGHQVIIMSGRRESCKPDSLQWLEEHTGIRFEPSVLHFRKDGDFRPDTTVKPEMLLGILGPSPWPEIVIFEDRQSMVDAWRSRGITCCQVAPGDF